MKHSREKMIPNDAINLISFSLLEAPNILVPFYPSWFNVWEAKLYKQALQRHHYKQWGFRRFGLTKPLPTSSSELAESLRRPGYRNIINGLVESFKVSYRLLSRQQQQILQHGKSALLYFDAWGQPSLFEGVNSWRDAFFLDLFPKVIAKNYGIKDFSCKLRGESSGLLSSLRIAMDYLNSGEVDTVYLCGIYRAIPALVLSRSSYFNLPFHRQLHRTTHISVERLGTMILSKSIKQGIALSLVDYVQLPRKRKQAVACLKQHWQQQTAANTVELFCGMSGNIAMDEMEAMAYELLPEKPVFSSIYEHYGDSGCLNMALSFHAIERSTAQYLRQFSCPHMLLSAADHVGGMWLIDSWLVNEKRE